MLCKLMLKQRIKNKNPVYISKVIYWSRKSGCVKKNTKKQEQTRFITIYVKQKK